jgi:hypothetical protein
MLPRYIVVLMLIAILASLASALVFLFRDNKRADSRRMVRALTWRIGLSVALFLLLIGGFYFGYISPHGVGGR